MGYESEVALAIRSRHEPAMLADSDIAQLLSEATRREKNDGLLFHWGWVKWYSSDEQVGALHRFLCDLEYGDDYLFMRIGEDDSDSDLSGGWWDNPFNLEYVRRIEFDGSSPLEGAHIIDLKSLNTRPEAKTCAQCGTALNDPVPGMPSMKHCPVCEP